MSTSGAPVLVSDCPGIDPREERSLLLVYNGAIGPG